MIYSHAVFKREIILPAYHAKAMHNVNTVPFLPVYMYMYPAVALVLFLDEKNRFLVNTNIEGLMISNKDMRYEVMLSFCMDASKLLNYFCVISKSVIEICMCAVMPVGGRVEFVSFYFNLFEILI